MPVLDANAQLTELVLDGHPVRLTNLDRPMFPQAGWRKRHLIEYYLAVARAILPHITGRPLSLGRFPDGITGRGFLQNECRGHPAWMRVLGLDLQSGVRRRYCVVDDSAGLAWIANLATVEVHPYPIDCDAPTEPVAVIIDLDPGPGTDLRDCSRFALEARSALAARGLRSAAKTSGGAGLHVVAGVSAKTFEWTRECARDVAAVLADAFPGCVTADARPSARRGAVLVDWMQNAQRRSTIAPYSLRAAEPAPRVSAPLTWDEVAAIAAGEPPPALDPASVISRIDRLGDLFLPALQPRSGAAA